MTKSSAEGARLGRYVVLEPGAGEPRAGEQGVRDFTVYDPKLDRRVRLALLGSTGAGLERDAQLSRYRAMAGLHHPHLLEILDVEEHGEGPDAQLAIAMASPPSASMASAGHALRGPALALRWAEHAAALAALHAAGITHGAVTAEHLGLDTDRAVLWGMSPNNAHPDHDRRAFAECVASHTPSGRLSGGLRDAAARLHASPDDAALTAFERRARALARSSRQQRRTAIGALALAATALVVLGARYRGAAARRACVDAHATTAAIADLGPGPIREAFTTVLSQRQQELQRRATKLCDASGWLRDQGAQRWEAQSRCLQEQSAQLDALARTSGELTEPELPQALSAAHALPRTCTTAPAPIGRILSTAEQQEVARMRVAFRLGRYDDARTLADALMDAPNPQVRTRAQFTRGLVAERDGEPELARTLLAAAVVAGREHGPQELAARAATQLVWIEGHRLDRPERALAWEQNADAAIAAAGDPAALRSQWLSVRATRLFDSGDYRRALADFERSLELRSTYADEHSPQLASSHNNVGAMLSWLGLGEAARRHYLKALEIQATLYGEHHPIPARARHSLAFIALTHRDPTRALKHATRAHHDLRASLGPDHPRTWRTRVTLAHAHVIAGRPKQGLELLDDALTRFEHPSKEDHDDAAQASLVATHAYLELGQLDAAGEQATRTRTLQDDRLGPDHPHRLAEWEIHADLAAARNRAPEAVRLYEHILKVGEHAVEPEHPVRVRAQARLRELATESPPRPPQ